MESEGRARGQNGFDVGGTLRSIDRRLRQVTAAGIGRVIEASTDPTSMRTAYAALNDPGGSTDGRAALRTALLADGLGEEQISEIDALYVRCLVDPTL